ncbi:hypothetical protein RHGRI_024951 [Rhododendron griersonianum]|uniref:Uncharacterized protein n=1 Tax=Rhododendron griersonianum TaxID=479676 RepID=A0AAV6J9C0_9ERIC|nr:hypothetical protein RHGRI_024951 [Rhododendron griersonianum]
MAPSKPDEPPFYYPLPQSSSNHPQNYVVLPIYIPAATATATATAPPSRRILWAGAFLFLALAVYFLYPCDPDLKISRLRLDRIHVQTTPFIALDVAYGIDRVQREAARVRDVGRRSREGEGVVAKVSCEVKVNIRNQTIIRQNCYPKVRLISLWFLFPLGGCKIQLVD